MRLLPDHQHCVSRHDLIIQLRSEGVDVMYLSYADSIDELYVPIK